MRWLLRLVLFWAITAPLFYVFGLPMLMDHLNGKTRATGFAQCVEHLRNENMLGDGVGKITAARGDAYCHCVSDGITFTKADILDMVKQQPPAALTTLSQSLSQNCTDELTREMNAAAARAYEAQQPSATPGLTNIETPN